MSSSNLRFALLICVGLLLLVLPMGTFHGDFANLSHAARKLMALRHFMVSILGLALIVLALVAQFFRRHTRRLEDTQA